MGDMPPSLLCSDGPLIAWLPVTGNRADAREVSKGRLTPALLQLERGKAWGVRRSFAIASRKSPSPGEGEGRDGGDNSTGLTPTRPLPHQGGGERRDVPLPL
jgi:hypothetical protein